MEYPTFFYRCPGPHWGPQWTTYDTRDVLNDEDMAAALADGWCENLHQAAEQYIAARDEAAAESAAKTMAAIAKPEPAVEAVEAVDDAPPTRAEMLKQAERIGLKVDGRWSDARLLDAIVAKMKEQAP